MIETGVCSRLAALLGTSSPTVQKSALHAVGNIVAGSQIQAQAALDGGALPLLTQLLKSDEAEVQRLAAWAISNVTAGSSDQIQAVIDFGAVPPLMALLRSPSRAVRKEAAFALVNVTTSPWPQHTLRLVEQGVVAPICELLSPSEPSDIVTVALEGLQNILKIGETTSPNPDGVTGAAGTQSADDGKASKGATAVTQNDMIRTVTAADGKARMMALRHHHRTGAINNISTVLLKTYFDATGLDTPTLADDSGSTAAAAAAATAAATAVAAVVGGSNKASASSDDTPTRAEGGKARSANKAAALTSASSSVPTSSGPSSRGGDVAATNSSPSTAAGGGGDSVAAPRPATDQPVTSTASDKDLSLVHRVEFVVTIEGYSRRQGCKHPAGQYSDIFDGKGAGRWRLLSYTHGTVAGKEGEWLSLYVSSADVDELACMHRWSRTVDYSITLLHPSQHAKNGRKAGGKADDPNQSITRRHTSVVFRGVHNDYEWGCRDFLPSDQVVEQGFLRDDSLYVKVEVELRDECPGQPLSVLSPVELRAHLAWAAENGLPRACIACLDTYTIVNGSKTGSDGEAASYATGSSGLVSAVCSEEWGTPLHLACIGWRPGNATVVALLLDCGAPVDALNKHGETPLVLAAREGGQPGVVAALLDRGANPCLCSKGGWSPMSAAASRGRDGVVRLLAHRGAPLEEVWPPLSALLEAAKAGHGDTALTLLECGADPEVQDEKGNTALWILLEKNMTDPALTMVQRHHASVAQCSRERSKVQRAKLLLKHAQRRANNRPQVANATESNSADLAGELPVPSITAGSVTGVGDVIGSGLLENGGDEFSAPGKGVAAVKNAEAAADELVRSLEEEEKGKASKTSKNRKKKDKAKAKKKQQQDEAERKKNEVDKEKQDIANRKEQEAADKREKDKRDEAERELRRREEAKAEWTRMKSLERQSTEALPDAVEFEFEPADSAELATTQSKKPRKKDKKKKNKEDNKDNDDDPGGKDASEASGKAPVPVPDAGRNAKKRKNGEPSLAAPTPSESLTFSKAGLAETQPARGTASASDAHAAPTSTANVSSPATASPASSAPSAGALAAPSHARPSSSKPPPRPAADMAGSGVASVSAPSAFEQPSPAAPGPSNPWEASAIGSGSLASKRPFSAAGGAVGTVPGGQRPTGAIGGQRVGSAASQFGGDAWGGFPSPALVQQQPRQLDEAPAGAGSEFSSSLSPFAAPVPMPPAPSSAEAAPTIAAALKTLGQLGRLRLRLVRVCLRACTHS